MVPFLLFDNRGLGGRQGVCIMSGAAKVGQTGEVMTLTSSWKVLLFVSAWLSVAVCGCVDQRFHQSRPKPRASAVSKRSNWRIGGDLRDLQNAIDGDFTTAAVSRDDYANATITIDLGKVCLFNTVVIDHGPNELGFCRRVALLTSSDGMTFTHRHIVGGTRRVTIVCFITPTLARYVRLEAVLPGSRPWSVGEVYMQ